MATRERQALVDGEPVEIVHVDGATALTATERAQVDVQISTAKRFPRDVAAARREARALALADEETAAACLYAMPRDGKVIEGPSARLAEIMAYSWGNLRVETDIEAIDDRHVTAVGTCFDLEKNVAVRVRVKRRITGKTGRRYSEDMIVVTGNAASSIALRNAVFKVIPGAYWKPIYEDARRLAMGSAESMAKRWKAAMDWFAKLAVTEDRVLAALGKADAHELVPEDFLTLTGLRTALMEGDTTVDEVFPRPGEDEEAGADLEQAKSRTESVLQKLRARKGAAAPADQANGEQAKPKQPMATEKSKAAKESPAQKALAEARTLYQRALDAHRPDLAAGGYALAEWETTTIGRPADEDWSVGDYTRAADALVKGEAPRAESD